MKKKTLIRFLILITLFNFSIPSHVVTAGIENTKNFSRNIKNSQADLVADDQDASLTKIPDLFFNNSIVEPSIDNFAKENFDRTPGPLSKTGLPDFVPGELLISMNFCSLSGEIRGQQYLEKVSHIANLVESKTGLALEKVQSLEPALVDKMVNKNLTRQEALRDITDKKNSLKEKTLATSFEHFDDPVTLLIRFQNKKINLDQILEQVTSELLRSEQAVHAHNISVEKNQLFYSAFVPNDPLYPQQWAHQNTQAPNGWDIETGNSSIKIAIIDTGVSYDHPDLSTNIFLPEGDLDFVDIDPASFTNSGFELIPAEDYVGIDQDPSDYNGHGTHSAGVAAGQGNNATGIAGVCHDCSIIPLRAGFSVLHQGQEYGVFSHAAILSALDKAIVEGAHIINMSFRGGYSAILHQKIDAAHNAGAVLIAAAGNNDIDDTAQAYPAALDNVIAVAATNINDVKSPYSNYGNWISVSAPGGDSTADSMILSTVPTSGGQLSHPSGYASAQGTSMAASYVAGLAGLILSKNADLTNNQVRSIIESTADNIDTFNPLYPAQLGAGRVNVYQALHSIEFQLPNIEIFRKSGVEISGGTANGIIEPDEIIELTIDLKNEAFPVSDLVATLTSSASNVAVYPNNNPYVYGDMSYSEVQSNAANPFRFSVAAPVPTDIPLTLTLSGNNGYNKIIHFTVNNSLFWSGDIFKTHDPVHHPELPLPMWRVCAHDIPAWGDYDNDGDLDLLFMGTNYQGTGQITKLYRNDGFVEGQWKFTEIENHGIIGSHLGVVAWGDFDNDGLLDVLITGTKVGFGPIAKIYRNNGDDTFTDIGEEAFPAPGVWASNAAWGDFDNDGYLDVVLTGYTGQGNISRIYKNNGDGTFTNIGSAAFPAPGVSYGSVAWGDFDNDGYLDVLLTGKTLTVRVSKIFKNNADGTFTDIGPEAFPAPGVWKGTSTWGDYNNNGFLDVLLTGSIDNNITKISKIYKNNGDGTFSENLLAELEGFSSDTATSAAWGDYDNDGYLDILLAGNTNTENNVAIIYRNNADGTFSNNQSLSGLSFWGGSLAWGDYDNDGYLDFIILSSLIQGSRIYRNSLNANPNTPPQPPKNVIAEISQGSQPSLKNVTISWNKASDTQTPQDGLTYNLYVGTTPLGIDVVSPMAHVNDGASLIPDGYRKIAAMGNQNKNLSWTITDLPLGDYYCGVQAVDTGLAGSVFTPCDFNTAAQTYVIEGTIFDADGMTPLPGVILSAPGLLQQTTNSQGFYQFVTNHTWPGGTVIPYKEGHEFYPEPRVYPPLQSNQYNQDYIAAQSFYTVSGTVLNANGQAIPGATVNGMDASSGTYSINVVSGSSLTITPNAAGHAFAPPSASFNNITENIIQNFVGNIFVYTISGAVTFNGQGLAGVEIKQGVETLAVTAANGTYAFFKPHGWSGMITPVKSGYAFTPPNAIFINLVEDQIRNFSATSTLHRISGTILLSSGSGTVSGVALKDAQGIVLAVTDNAGYYQFDKASGWSGKVIPHKDGYRFKPDFREYKDLDEDQIGQDYYARPPASGTVIISGFVTTHPNDFPVAGVVLTPKSFEPQMISPEIGITDETGFYVIKVSTGWTGTVTPSKPGLSFKPQQRVYDKPLTQNQERQNYIASGSTGIHP